jgi:hypothetical protein
MATRIRTSFICDLGYQPGMKLPVRPATTPDCEPHEPWPDGYMASSDYADLMMVTHTQRACKGCGLYLIWEPKPAVPEPTRTEGDQ